MRWTLRNETYLYNYWRLEDDEPLAELKYSTGFHSLRLTAANKRLFFLEEETGMFQNKILIETEYGVVIGEANFLKRDFSNGTLLINGKKFYYGVQNGALVIYNKHREKLADCTVEKIEGLDKFQLSALVFGFTWYFLSDAYSLRNERQKASA